MGLKELRAKKNLTQKQLATQLGWTNSRVVRLENVMMDLTPTMTEELAKFFGMSVQNFEDEFDNL